MAIFPGKPGLATFIGATDDGSGSDKWSYKTCKVQSSSQIITTKTNTQLFTGWMPFLSAN